MLACLFACLACLGHWSHWPFGALGFQLVGGEGFALFFDGPFVALAVWSPGVPVGGEMEDEREEETGRREEELWV